MRTIASSYTKERKCVLSYFSMSPRVPVMLCEQTFIIHFHHYTKHQMFLGEKKTFLLEDDRRLPENGAPFTRLWMIIAAAVPAGAEMPPN